MALNVKFLKGTLAQYTGLTTKDQNTFYYLDDSVVYLGTTKLSNATDIASAIARIGVNEGNISTLNTSIGSLDSLATTKKTSLVEAINEVRQAVETGGTGSVVTMEKSSDGLTYTIKQGNTEVGKINIPKDLVVQSGEIVDTDNGKVLRLTIANQETPLDIPVGELVDVYVGQANAAQVKITVTGSTISAELVDGGIVASKLSDGAVTTAKISDGNVTLAKLSNTVQASLGKADSAVQSVTASTKNGNINVDGTDIFVTGLGSAAYTSEDAYDKAGAAAAILGKNTDKSTANTVYGAKAAAAEALTAANNAAGSVTTAINALNYNDAAVADKYVSSVKQVNGVIEVTREDLNFDAKGSAATVQTNLETALTWGTI